MKTTRRILTIDGGGLRGVFSAAIIEQMELITGKAASEIFDCFCGTSAGSFIAAGLASGIPASAIKQAYIELGGAIFSQDGSASDGCAIFEKQLRKIFGDKRAKDVDRHLAIPARNMRIGKLVFFGNFPPDQNNDESFWDDTEINENEYLWRIVRRSTALPPHFPPAGEYLDGGVSPFANPSYAAFIGVQHRLAWKLDDSALRIYSVGTGFHRRCVERNLADLSAEEHLDVMLDVMLQDINHHQHLVMKRRHADGTIWYKRYNISFDAKGFEKLGISSANRDFLALASTSRAPVEELAEIGAEVGRVRVNRRDFDDDHL